MTRRPSRSTRVSSKTGSTRSAAPSAVISTSPGRSPSRSRSALGMTRRPALSMVVFMTELYQNNGMALVWQLPSESISCQRANTWGCRSATSRFRREACALGTILRPCSRRASPASTCTKPSRTSRRVGTDVAVDRTWIVHGPRAVSCSTLQSGGCDDGSRRSFVLPNVTTCARGFSRCRPPSANQCPAAVAHTRDSPNSQYVRSR